MASSGPRMDVWLEAKVKNLSRNVEIAMEDLAGEGEALLTEYIATRGTGKTWKRTYTRGGVSRSASKPGRVWTGQMLEDIGEATLVGDDFAIASFGWLNNVEEYYKEQELGFDHEATGEHIEGMFIMEDAAEVMKQRFRDRIKRVVREF